MKKLLIISAFLLVLGLMPLSGAESYGNEPVGPVLMCFSPAIISPGDEVTITGYHLGTSGSNVDVYLGTDPASIITWSDTKIVIKAPSYFNKYTGLIVFKGIFATSSSYRYRTIGNYRVKPIIEKVSPDDSQGYFNVAKIEGNYFGDQAKEVFFGDTKVSVIYWGNTAISVVVPENASQPITVKVSDVLSDTMEFHYLNPESNSYGALTAVSPAVINGEIIFTLFGSNLSNSNVIKIVGGANEYVVPDSSVNYSNNMAEVTLPDGVLPGGTYSIHLLRNNSKISELLNALTVVSVEQPADIDSHAADETNNDAIAEDVIVKEKSLVVKKDASLTRKLKGRILLQVEEHGEAWYVHPVEERKFYLKDGPAAYQMLREFGLGITNADLEKIPAAGSTAPGDANLTNRLKGYILLQVEEYGEAWYVNPADGQRYYLKDGLEAYRIMRELSLGITNEDLRKIEVGEM